MRSSQTEVHQWEEALTITEDGFKTNTHNLIKEGIRKGNGGKRINTHILWKLAMEGQARQEIELNVIV